MKPYYQDDAVTLYHSDCLVALQSLDDNSVDSIVTDPPYGLAFMGKKWDYDVPSEDIWRECLRVLKPGGHLLAFAGTRTQHRMACRIEDAGFEIRDMIAWVYGCLSEDTEVLTIDGWERYHIARTKEILVYDIQADVYKWERPERWNEYRVESDTAYRIQSDHTDQIVSRGHRCIVERGGELVFVPADELAGVEAMPTLPSDFLGVPEGRAEVLRSSLQRSLSGAGLGEAWQGGINQVELKSAFEGQQRRKESGMERRGDLLQTQGQVCQSVDQVREVPSGVCDNGTQGRLCDATSVDSGKSDGQAINTNGMRSPHQPRRDGQPAGEPDAVCDECGSQAVRTRASYRTDLATVTAIEYSGLIWCPTVSTGAFVARRNGKVFITGNSGFPKSLDIGKAIEAKLTTGGSAPKNLRQRAMGEDYEPHRLAGTEGFGISRGGGIGADESRDRTKDAKITTDAAKQWDGWGSALKPALEPITMARKPLDGTIAGNVLKHGVGGINVDGCRVGTERGVPASLSKNKSPNGFGPVTGKGGTERDLDANMGRFPANLIHDGSDEVVGLFPETTTNSTGRGGTARRAYDHDNEIYGKGIADNHTPFDYQDGTGSAARFFYTAKADASERRNSKHPTVKPIALMRYLVRLVTPIGATVLDPFMGSGTTIEAARLESCKSIGMEREAEYCSDATKRLSQGVLF